MTARDLPSDRYAFRPLTGEDAGQLAALHIRIWRETYAGLMAQSALDALDVEHSTRKWRDILGADDAPRVLGAFDGQTGELAGWITVGEPGDADAPAPTELRVLNVAAEHQGTGLAHELLIRELADRAAYLWVVEGNERAIAFYRRHGFELDGVTKEQAGEGNVDLRMTRSLP